MFREYSKRQIVSGSVLGVLLLVMLYLQFTKDSSSSRSDTPAERAAVHSCVDLVKLRAVFPSSVDVHAVMGIGTDLNGANGKPRVSVDFDAKNGLGNMLPYRALCDFSTDPPQVTISNR